MSEPILFGIPNCDTVRKARKWLESQGIAHEFVDLRADTPPAHKINEWLSAVGPERLINRRSTAFKQLSQRDKTALEDGDTVSVLLAQPTLIKRPVLQWNKALSIGFKEDDYAQLFSI